MARKNGKGVGRREMTPTVRNGFFLALKRMAGVEGTPTSAMADFIEGGLTHPDWDVRISMFRAVSQFAEKQVAVRGQVDVTHTVSAEGMEALHAALCGVAHQAGILEGEVVDVPQLEAGKESP